MVRCEPLPTACCLSVHQRAHSRPALAQWLHLTSRRSGKLGTVLTDRSRGGHQWEVSASPLALELDLVEIRVVVSQAARLWDASIIPAPGADCGAA